MAVKMSCPGDKALSKKKEGRKKETIAHCASDAQQKDFAEHYKS